MEKGKVIILIVSIAVILSYAISNYITSYMEPFSASAILAISTFTLPIGWIVLLIYVPYHARKNGQRMILWVLLTLFLSGLGGLLYVSDVIKPYAQNRQVKK